VVNGQNASLASDVPEDVHFMDLGCKRVRYALPKIAHLLWRHRPDVVLSTLGHLNLALSLIRPLLPSKTMYVARETNIVSRLIAYYPMPRLWTWAYRLFYSRFDRLICQSKDMAQDLVQGYGFPERKIRLIHNPVDAVRLRQLSAEGSDDPVLWARWQAANGLRLVAAGRLAPEKGFDMLVAAMGMCRDLPLTLFILGEGSLRAELEQQLRNESLQDRVVLCGFQRNPYVYLARADAFVLSSRFEGLPNVVLEAMACRTPVVALSAPGGIDELIGGVAGCVIAADVSAESLAQALRQWVASSRDRLDPSCTVRFEVGSIMAKYESVFDEVLADARH
jgi:glycosyltransferase involved in cell wall biosynthesis